MSVAARTPASLRRHRPFALYWVSRVSSTIALQMQAVAVGWQMYDITHNPLDLGLVGLTQFIPAALFVLVAGHVADRYDRRKIVRICQMTSGLATATLAIGTAGGLMTRESLLAVVFVTGSARAFEQTTMTTLLPGIVPLSLLSRATAAGASATQIAVIGGPAMGGLLYAVSPVLVYALCCTLYFTSSILIGLVTVERNATVARAGEPRRAVRRLSLHPPQPGDLRRHHARPVRGRSSAASMRCCRCSRATCSMPGRGGSACCAPRPASAR